MNCNNCGKITQNKCSGCKEIFYCSRKCQTDKWKSHKNVCLLLSNKEVMNTYANIIYESYLTDDIFGLYLKLVKENQKLKIKHLTKPEYSIENSRNGEKIELVLTFDNAERSILY